MDTNVIMDKQRKLSAAQKDTQAQNFLSYKESMKFKRVERFHQHYSIRKELGSGAFGSVKLGTHRKTKMPCAIKVIRKEDLQRHNVY
jgi:serine/threonine protein kinase